MKESQKDPNLSPMVGELFSRQYVERKAPLQDNLFFRNRLDAFLSANHSKDYTDLAAYLRQEAGLMVKTYQGFVQYNFTSFFLETKVELVLSAITLIWRFLQKKYPEAPNPMRPTPHFKFRDPKDKWHEFVSRALREENMSYILDEKCGVHFL